MSTEASRADDFAHLERDLRVGWLLIRGQQMVAGTVRPFLVVPGTCLADQMVQVPFCHDYKVVQDLLLQRLDDAFQLRPQVSSNTSSTLPTPCKKPIAASPPAGGS